MKKKKFLILFLILLLVVGYAAVTSTLNITGLTKVGENKDDFDVYFSNAKEGTKEGTVENKKVIKDDTHIAFNKEMKSVGETYVLEYDVTNGSRTYDANISITCTESTEYLKITNEFDTTTNLPATETRSGKLTVEVIKSYVGTTEKPTLDTTISCEITGNAQERTSKATGTPASKVVQGEKWVLTEDADGNGELSIGDLITLGTESFYVYNVDGDNVKALAQYNLLVEGGYNVAAGTGTGLQDATALGYGPAGSTTIGTVAFDSTEPYSNVYADSTIKAYVDEYGAKLNEMDGQVSNVSLITKEELEVLGCDETSAGNNGWCSKAPAFVYSTTYWISYPDESDSYIVWNIDFNSVLNYASVTEGNSFGVRPVITVSKAIIEVPEKPKAWKLTNDADSNGEISIGDLITLGTESFYVYNVDGENVKAMAQYNLLVGNSYDGTNTTPLENPTGLQDATALGNKSGSTTIGTVAFDSSGNRSNVYANSTIKPYVDAYATKLNELNGQVSNASLITKEELESLGCSGSLCSGAPAWVTATSYWTSSPDESNSRNAWGVSSDGYFRVYRVGYDDGNYGVRPVITISKSLIG